MYVYVCMYVCMYVCVCLCDCIIFIITKDVPIRFLCPQSDTIGIVYLIRSGAQFKYIKVQSIQCIQSCAETKSNILYV